jgi:hypothetical protein
MSATSFQVRADRDQAPRWRRVARFLGHRSVVVWLAALADAQARELSEAALRWQEEQARTSSPPALVWRRGRFGAAVQVGERLSENEVEGWIGGFFGIFRERKRVGVPQLYPFTLVHLPTGRHLLDLRLRRDGIAAAEELVRLDVAWQSTDPEKVMIGPDVAAARAVLARWRP